MMNESLGSIANDLDMMLQEIKLNEGEVSDGFLEHVSSKYEALEDKVDGWINWLDGLDANEDMLKKQIERLTRKKSQVNNLRIRLKDYLAFNIKQNPGVKFEGKLGSIKVQKSPAKFIPKYEGFKLKETVVSTDTLNKYPELQGYVRTKEVYIIDPKEIREAVKAGHLGVGEFQQGESVRIRG
jgi:translation initiation factor 2 alpha subunit (eIF-2alpha)